MPRNYSIKDTIQKAKDEIHRKKMEKLQDSVEVNEDKPTLIRFDNPKSEQKEDKPTHKWYQFWKK